MKEKIISRTMESTKANVVCFDVAKNAMVEKEYIFSGKMDKDAVLKTVRSMDETPEFIPTFTKECNVESKLYGMKESVFIKKGFVLDERTAKVDGEKIITRSIESTIVTFNAFDVNKMQMSTGTEYFSGKVTAETALKTLRTLESDTFKIVRVEKVESDVKLYAIKESVFLEYSFELPPRMAEKTETAE